MPGGRKPIIHGRDHAPGGADPIPGIALVGDWIAATLLPDWTGEAYYRHVVGATELRGSISGGASGTVAFILPVGFRPDFDVSYVTDMASTGGSFAVARIAVTAATGEVTVYFPATTVGTTSLVMGPSQAL